MTNGLLIIEVKDSKEVISSHKWKLYIHGYEKHLHNIKMKSDKDIYIM